MLRNRSKGSIYARIAFRFLTARKKRWIINAKKQIFNPVLKKR